MNAIVKRMTNMVRAPALSASALAASALAVLVLSVPVFADTLAITNARVHTQAAAGVLEDATVVIEDGRIMAVGSNLSVPRGATVIDASGHDVTPGLIVGYSTIGLSEVSAVDESNDMVVEDAELGAAFSVAGAVNPDSVLFGVARAGGVTHALVGPWPGNNLFAGRASLIRLDGNRDAVLARDVALVVAVGEAAGDFSGGSRAAALQWLARGFEEARRVADGADADEQTLPAWDLEVLGEVLTKGGRVAAIANRASDIRQVVELLVGLGLRPVILGGAEAWKVADVLAAHEVAVILDPLANRPETYDSLGARLDNATLLHAAGVRFAIMEGSGHEVREIRQYAGNLVVEGVPPEVALGAITSSVADIWGASGRGRIEAGAAADLVIWTGDPLELSSWADTVIVAGAVVPHDSRQLRLQERYRDPQRIYDALDAN